MSHSQFITEPAIPLQRLSRNRRMVHTEFALARYRVSHICQLKDFVFRMREKGLKATACNCRIRAVNAYLKWAGSSLRVPKLKEPELILPTFTLRSGTSPHEV